MAALRIGFDIGGTFTDFVAHDPDSGAIFVHKALSTPDDPARGAIEGLDRLVEKAGVGFGEVAAIVHGTTIVTNAVITRGGARTALLTTRGFRDVIETGTEQRYDIHNLFLDFPAPLVPRALRFEIDERVSRDGTVLRPIDAAEVQRALEAAVAAGAEAVGVCFLHAFTNDAHEQAVARIVQRSFPGLHLSLSSEVCPEIREYERATTTVANAYVQPLVDPYVERIEESLLERGFRGRFFLMQSSGGLASPAMARQLPIRLLESGPAGGAIAAGLFGTAAGHRDVIAFDMGGTTAKICMIGDGKAHVAPMMEAAREDRFQSGSGLPIRAPVIEMIEIGAGGGSIAQVDAFGRLKVGPKSAGASPGPACYGRGGREPTVTDANLVLGYLDPVSFLGGRLRLDRAAAEAAFAPIAEAIGGSAVEAAWGVFSVVCENMASAARVHVVAEGHDPRHFAMVAFGGAGPAHAIQVARLLGIREVVIPPASGAASALGFLGGVASHEATRSSPGLLAALNWNSINALLADLQADAQRLLETAGVDGEVEVERSVELRLAGQIHDLKVPLPPGPLSEQSIPAIAAAFGEIYRTLYGRGPGQHGFEARNWSVTCSAPKDEMRIGRIERPDAAGGTAVGRRRAWFPGTGFTEVPVHQRYALAAGARVEGPAIIVEDEATTVLPPGDRIEVDAAGNLVATLDVSRRAVAKPDASLDLEADPISLEIMWSRLISITEECWSTVIRTAFSLIIGECQDFTCEILDRDGNSIAHSPRAMPMFNASLMGAVKSMLEVFPADTLAEGDILITNDPWLCAGHLFDIAVVKPVFHGGRVVALIGAVGHVSDIGGTRDRMRARDVFEEGFHIPPMKLYRAGTASEDLMALLRTNVRNPEQVLGDVEALVAATGVGASRLEAFIGDYGIAGFEALIEVIQRRAEAAMRAAIRAVPDGVYSHELRIPSLGSFARLPVKITVAGDAVEVDYEGCPAQLAFGGLNCTIRYTEAETLFALKCLLSPSIPGAAGAYRALTVKAPAASLLNCERPASVGLRHITGAYLSGNIFHALAPGLPDRVLAAPGLSTNVSVSGGRAASEHIFMGGGQGASARRDGKSALLWPTSAATGSVEILETRADVLVVEKQLATDSGGAGRHRGGLGQRMRFHALPGGKPALASFYPKGVGLENDGLFGGHGGLGAAATLRASDGAVLEDFGEGALAPLPGPDRIIEVRVAGGSGYGNPLDRPPEEVQADLDAGYISPDAATGIYGCVLDAEGRVDAAATWKLRNQTDNQRVRSSS